MQIIIPMSGLGKRFENDGHAVPKPLIEVDGYPMIQHVVNLFPNETNISFICNELHLRTTNMREILYSFCPNGKIYEVPVENRQGPVHAVSLIEQYIDDFDEVIISYCDYGTDWEYEQFMKENHARNADGAIACYKGFHPHMLGTDNYAFLKETECGSKWMKQIQEKKPFTNNRMEEYASNGTYYFKTGAIMKKYFQQLMDSKETINNEYYVSMVYNFLVKDHLKVNIFEIQHMLQWGTPQDLQIYTNWSNYFRKIINKQKEYEDHEDTTLILPMAGVGSRFYQKGYKNPKPLIDINGKPMIIQAVCCLPKTSRQVFICQKDHLLSYSLETTIQNYFYHSEIQSVDHVTQGQACTCEIGINNSHIYKDLGKPILISACDNGVYYDKDAYSKLLNDTSIDIIVWTFRDEPTSKNNPNMYAWLEVDEDNFVKNVSCKSFDKKRHDIRKSHVIIGTMFFRKGQYFLEGLNENYKHNIRSNNEFYVDDILNQNIRSGLKVKVFEVEHYICWGTPDDYETYCYWQRFFDKCEWHPYKREKDVTSEVYSL